MVKPCDALSACCGAGCRERRLPKLLSEAREESCFTCGENYFCKQNCDLQAFVRNNERPIAL
jgi:hypothetical protein